jgi:hypothetical protein
MFWGEENHEKLRQKSRIIFKITTESRVSCVATNNIYSQLTVHVFQRWTPAANRINSVTLLRFEFNSLTLSGMYMKGKGEVVPVSD